MTGISARIPVWMNMNKNSTYVKSDQWLSQFKLMSILLVNMWRDRTGTDNINEEAAAPSPSVS